MIGALIYGHSGHWYRKADVGYRSTYLAVRGGGNVEIHDVKYHGDESGHARKGVKLQKEQINQRLRVWLSLRNTNTYRPAVRSTSSDDTPFVVK